MIDAIYKRSGDDAAKGGTEGRNINRVVIDRLSETEKRSMQHTDAPPRNSQETKREKTQMGEKTRSISR